MENILIKQILKHNILKHNILCMKHGNILCISDLLLLLEKIWKIEIQNIKSNSLLIFYCYFFPLFIFAIPHL